MKNFQIKKLFFNESLIATQFNLHVNTILPQLGSTTDIWYYQEERLNM